MLESVVDLLERTNGMATGRSDPTELEIKALYKALEAVHADYVGFLDMIQRASVAGEPVGEIAQVILLRGPEADCERTAVLAHMRLLVVDALGAEAYPFLDAVATYFLAMPLSGQGVLARSLKRAAEHACDAPDSALHARAEIACSIHAGLRGLQRQWDVVCREYGKLRALAKPVEAIGAQPNRRIIGAIGARLAEAALAEALP